MNLRKFSIMHATSWVLWHSGHTQFNFCLPLSNFVSRDTSVWVNFQLVAQTPTYPVMCPFALFISLCDHIPPILQVDRQIDRHYTISINMTYHAIYQHVMLKILNSFTLLVFCFVTEIKLAVLYKLIFTCSRTSRRTRCVDCSEIMTSCSSRWTHYLYRCNTYRQGELN